MCNKSLGAVILVVVMLLVTGCISPGADDADESLASAKTDTIVLVENAVAAIALDGPNAFPAFREVGSEWVEGDRYVFVWRTDGLRVVYPPDLEGEGIDMASLTDAYGTPIGQLFIQTATTAPFEGWVSYYWPKPGGSAPELKQAFISRVSYGSVDYLVGSGFYVTDYVVIENTAPCSRESTSEDSGGLFSVCNVVHPDNYAQDIGVGYSVARVTMAAGSSLQAHAMTNPELWIVLSGTGTLSIEDVPIPLAPGVVVLVPAGATQAANAGTDLAVLVVDEPAWAPENEEAR